MKHKTCTVCFCFLPTSDFYKNKTYNDGLSARCKECHNKQQKEYKENNRQTYINRRKSYYTKNKKILLEKSKIWRKNNKEYINEKAKQYREKHRDELRLKAQAYRNKDKEQFNKHRRETYNAPKRREYGHARRAKLKGLEGHHTDQEIEDLYIKQQGICANPYCRKKLNIKTRSLDHIIPVSKKGSDSVSNLQWLCISCNSSKHSQDNTIWLEKQKIDKQTISCFVKPVEL